jgi:hypothetical protein
MEKSDSSRKREPTVSLQHICYDIAYFILPYYVHNEPEKIVTLCTKSPSAAGPFLYLIACKHMEIEPRTEDASRLCWHHDRLDDRRDCLVLEYPTPPPVELSEASLEQLSSGDFTLAPYFSAVVHEGGGCVGGYYVLGQAPMGGGTTLRSVSRDGTNSNLGPGPEPRLESLLAALRGRRRT